MLVTQMNKLTSCLFAICMTILMATSARANVLYFDDTKKLFLIGDKADRIGTDIAAENIMLQGPSSECMKDLDEVASRISNSMTLLGELTEIAGAMLHKDDESYVLQVVRINITSTLKSNSLNRSRVNGIMGLCGSNAVVSTKGQVLLDLIDEVTSAVQPIAQRLGVHE
jgi:hypothetical protein